MYLGVYAFIGGTIILGFSIGFWIEGRLMETHQNVRLPSALGAEVAY